MSAWTKEHTQAWLTGSPLPADLRWRHRDGGVRIVSPRYRLTAGYGKWLRETPYFPGLFEAVHELLAAVPYEAALPAPAEIVRALDFSRENGLPPVSLFSRPGGAAGGGDAGGGAAPAGGGVAGGAGPAGDGRRTPGEGRGGADGGGADGDGGGGGNGEEDGPF
jgi:hypothetical protein